MHMLEGLDSDWIDTGNRSQRQLLRSSPGEYVFRVRATNADGLWSETSWRVRSYHSPSLSGRPCPSVPDGIYILGADWHYHSLENASLHDRTNQLEALVRTHKRPGRQLKKNCWRAMNSFGKNPSIGKNVTVKLKSSEILFFTNSMSGSQKPPAYSTQSGEKTVLSELWPTIYEVRWPVS